MRKLPSEREPLVNEILSVVSGVLVHHEIQSIRVWVTSGCQPQEFEELESQLRVKPTLSQVDIGGAWPFAVYDRDVFRPLQYCMQYLWINNDWVARGIVEMSCLHLEALVKRISGSRRLPLGQSLRHARARKRIPPDTWHQLLGVTQLYNDAKHKMDHPIGTHLFEPLDAWLIHFAGRRLGYSLFSLAGIADSGRGRIPGER